MISANAVRFSKGGLVNLPWHTCGFDEFVVSESGRGAVFGVFHTDACVGLVGFNVVKVGQMTSHGVGIWYCVDAAYEGKGLVTHGVREALPLFSKEVPHITTAVIHCSASNRKSVRVAEALEMRIDTAAAYVCQTSCRSRQTFTGFSASLDRVLAPRMRETPLCAPTAARRMVRPTVNPL